MDDGDDVQGTFDAEGAFIPVKVKVVNVLHLVFEALVHLNVAMRTMSCVQGVEAISQQR